MVLDISQPEGNGQSKGSSADSNKNDQGAGETDLEGKMKRAKYVLVCKLMTNGAIIIKARWKGKCGKE